MYRLREWKGLKARVGENSTGKEGPFHGSRGNDKQCPEHPNLAIIVTITTAVALVSVLPGSARRSPNILHVEIIPIFYHPTLSRTHPWKQHDPRWRAAEVVTALGLLC